MKFWHLIPAIAVMALGAAAQAQSKPIPGVATPIHDPAAPSRGSIPLQSVEVKPAPGYGAPVAPSPGYAPAPILGNSSGPILGRSPAEPFAGVTLPTQRGDGAYQGGGVVLEQDENGVTRQVR